MKHSPTRMQALNDENVQGDVPTTQEIKRQLKRVKYAEQLESQPDQHYVTEADVGSRIVRLNSMVTSHIVNNDINPALNEFIRGVRQAIRDECLPGGAIRQVINEGRALDRAIASAQYANSKLTIRSLNVTPIPLQDNAHFNLDIPATADTFFAMRLAQIDPLLRAYDVLVPQAATRVDKLTALANYFRLSVITA